MKHIEDDDKSSSGSVSSSPSSSPSAADSSHDEAASDAGSKRVDDDGDVSMEEDNDEEDTAADDEDDVGEEEAGDASAAEAEDTKLLSKEERDALLKEEEAVLQQQRDLQSKSLEAVKQNLTQDTEWSKKSAREKKMAFLMAQSDVFTSFLMGGSSAMGKEMSKNKAAVKEKSNSRRNKSSELEDAEAVAEMDESRFTRVTQQPKAIKFGTMKPYQLEGLNWMIRLHDSGVNGILADEMGLGKTLQSISLLAYLREARGIEGPHIIIVPKSTTGNWMRELKRWCPSIRAFKFMGNKEERAIQRETVVKKDFDALVLSYEVAIIEKAVLQKIKWKYLLIDEAHRVKNEHSKLSKVVREFHVEHRLLITGTPLQNNLHELWALLNFLLPDIFTDSEDFDSWFNVDEEKGQENVIKKLHTVLRPFLLRRLKADVEHSLPPKIETKLYVGLSEMQREWYMRVLHRDATHLNAIGGSDRVRLLNILMQLRKVCNHPYLFEGAEPGPPYMEGPHLWENCGKLTLLHRLLPRLKAQQSRVLIFCQMTSMMDILEDYMRYNAHDYCRLDGSTKGEDRDFMMEEFNEPTSTKFCFLLSTRAGGLGINLATADIVILFDSDWNPQVDLQAMDRAHRIGQKKLVRVFRFITDGTVEEKIVERAERKLYLDAAIIQQGRLAQQNRKLSKDELMTMVRFGADEIFNARGSMITDDDIDAILAKGEERTESMKAKIAADMQHNLANFSLSGDSANGVSSLYEFEGEVFSKDSSTGQVLPSTFIALPQRERKANYNEDEYYRKQAGIVKAKKVKKDDVPKTPVVHDYQFFNQEVMIALLTKKNQIEIRRKELMRQIKEAKSEEQRLKPKPKKKSVAEGGAEADGGASASNSAGEEEPDENLKSIQLEKELDETEMDAKDAKQLERLEREGFGEWTRRDLKQFITSCERYGRADKANVCAEVAQVLAKDVEQVKRYFDTFWKRYTELKDHAKYLEKIERGEKRLERNEVVKQALARKCSRYSNPLRDMKLHYPSGYKSKGYILEEDVFLVVMMNKYGPLEHWSEIRDEIRKAWQFRFDWFFKSRTIAELQKRGEMLTRMVEKENEELKTKSGKDEEELVKKAKKPSSSSSSSKSKSKSKSKSSSSSKSGATGSSSSKSKKRSSSSTASSSSVAKKHRSKSPPPTRLPIYPSISLISQPSTSAEKQMACASFAKSVEEDLDDDDEEEDFEADDAQPQSQQRRHSQQLYLLQQPVPGQPNSAATASAVAQARKYQRRRSSTIGATRSDDLSDPQSIMEAGDDKTLRPRFLKERSATHADLSALMTEPLTVPQSKAGAFLLSVMAKARGYNLYDMRRVPFNAYRNASTNSLSYANRKKEQGAPLRMGSLSTRRLGVFSESSSCSLLEEQVDENKVKGEVHERRSMEALVQELGVQKQLILKQLDILHEVLQRLTEADYDREAQARLCKQLVDASFIKEVASSLREFRFHIGLQHTSDCFAHIDAFVTLNTNPSVFGLSIQDDLEIILQKAVSVHAGHERFAVTTSTLLHAIAESKTAANVRAYKDGEAEKAKRRRTIFVEAVAAELALKFRHHSGGTAESPVMSSHHSRGRSERERMKGAPDADPDANEGGEDLCDLAERGRVPSRSGSRLRRALAANVAPPVLSANYNLQFAKKSLAAESASPNACDPPSTATSTMSTSAKKPTRCGPDPPLFAQLRPMSSPTRSFSSSLYLNSDSLATAAYTGTPLFVEPSPLPKRLGNQGISSANGTRRRLSFKKRPPQRIPTPILPSCLGGFDGSDGGYGDARATGIASERVPIESPVSESERGRNAAESCGGQESDEYEDEAYEDDFADDSEPGTSRLVDAQKLAADTELIDLLHDLPSYDALEPHVSSSVSSDCTLSLSQAQEQTTCERDKEQREIAATMCIQRHVRGHIARKAYVKAQAHVARQAKVIRAKAWLRQVSGKCCEAKVRRTKSHCESGEKETLASPMDRKLGRCSSTSAQRIGDMSKKSSWTSQLYQTTAERGVVAKSNRARATAYPDVTALQREKPAKSPDQIRKKPSSAPSAMATSGLSSRALSGVKSPSFHNFQTSPNKQQLQQQTRQQGNAATSTDALRRIQALYSQGLMYHKENQLALAVDSYEAALRIPASGREFASLHINLGSAQMTQLQFPQALASFQRAERIHPTNAKAAYNCALALMHLDRTVEAEEQTPCLCVRVSCRSLVQEGAEAGFEPLESAAGAEPTGLSLSRKTPGQST